jgi:hypothetical protein
MKFLFRGDNRNPSEIFKEGFIPLGNNTDLMQYVLYNTDSIYVGTSKSVTVARKYFISEKEGGYIYVIKSSHLGIDVNTVFPKNPHAYEFEIAIPNGIKTQYILGARQVLKGKRKPFIGSFIKNPNFK